MGGSRERTRDDGAVQKFLIGSLTEAQARIMSLEERQAETSRSVLQSSRAQSALQLTRYVHAARRRRKLQPFSQTQTDDKH